MVASLVKTLTLSIFYYFCKILILQNFNTESTNEVINQTRMNVSRKLVLYDCLFKKWAIIKLKDFF